MLTGLVLVPLFPSPLVPVVTQSSFLISSWQVQTYSLSKTILKNVFYNLLLCVTVLSALCELIISTQQTYDVVIIMPDL